MQYPEFVVGVEGTWDLPATHPFEASFRVVFEKAVVENAGGKFMLYTDDAAEEIEIENIQVFADTVTLQNLEMIPLAELPGSWNHVEVYDTPPQNL